MGFSAGVGPGALANPKSGGPSEGSLKTLFGNVFMLNVSAEMR